MHFGLEQQQFAVGEAAKAYETEMPSLRVGQLVPLGVCHRLPRRRQAQTALAVLDHASELRSRFGGFTPVAGGTAQGSRWTTSTECAREATQWAHALPAIRPIAPAATQRVIVFGRFTTR